MQRVIKFVHDHISRKKYEFKSDYLRGGLLASYYQSTRRNGYGQVQSNTRVYNTTTKS